jgi:glyoxylate reductase
MAVLELKSHGRAEVVRERLTVVVTRRLPEPVETRLSELFNVRLRSEDTPMTRSELAQAMQEADVLVPTVTDAIDAGLLAQAGSRLKLIANYGAGVDHIDVATARQRGILVSNTPGVLTDDTADMAMALIMAVVRRIPEGLALMQKGEWEGWAPTAMLGGRLAGRRLGILGMGRIGQAVARRARAFGMQIHYHNRRRLRPEIEEELEATYWESLDQMVARMDVISVNCPSTPSTFHLMNARRLKLMKPDAVIINTSRGEVIDEHALTRMLRAGDIAGAGLDVYEHGIDINPRLRELPNVVLLPHMGSATVEGRIEMGEKVLLNIKTFEDGHRPPDQVVPSML